MSIFNFSLGLSPLWPDNEDIKTNCGYGFFLHLCQFSSVAQLCPTLCDPRDYNTPGLPVHHQLPEFTLIHVHWVSDAIQLSHPVLSPSPPAINLSQHQSLFQRVGSLHQVAKVLKLQLQASVLPVSIWGWYPLGLIGLISLQLISRVFSSTTIQKHQVFGPD